MKLIEAQVFLYWNIVDSTLVPIEPGVTCLVGKNEAGKTAFLRALYQLNPAYERHLEPNVTDDYPRWRLARDRRKSSLEDVVLVQGTFSLDDSERQNIAETITPSSPFPLPPSSSVIAERTYGGDLLLSLSVPENELIASLIDTSTLTEDRKEAARKCETLDELSAFIKQAKSETAEEEKASLKALRALATAVKKGMALLEDIANSEIKEVLLQLLPRFFYFSQYSMLRGRLDLTYLLSKDSPSLEDHERTALSLLELAGASGQEFMSEDFEYRVSELEAAANLITQEVLKYWTQNEDLIVRLVGDAETVSAPQGPTVVHRYVDIRLNDLRHQVTTNLERHSPGFRWFFSFIAAFSEFEGTDENMIVLLDEPGLNLHARAQSDFIRFIDERLALESQVLYTTHSPFMVDPTKLERVRLVEDLTTREDPNLGARISTDVLSVHGDTLFPLQAALGYDLAQNLFIGPHNLIVEGPSDYIYLITFSEHLASLGKEPLDERWSIVPVGGADKVPTFVALLGSHLDITVLLDATGKGNQRLMNMASRGLLDPKRILTVGRITGTKQADIEDLFTVSEYLTLFNAAFETGITESDLVGNDPILRRLERHIGKKFEHTPPATELLKNKVQFLSNINDETLDRFGKLIQFINQTLPSRA